MKNKRGSTLTELVIVMAVVEIMSVMVVSFTIICHGWVTIGTTRFQTLQDGELLSQAFHEFVSAYDDDGYSFFVSDVHTLSVKDAEGNVHSNMTFDPDEGILRFDLYGTEVEYPVDSIDDFTFGVRNVGENGHAIVAARVNYTFLYGGKKMNEQRRSYDMVVAARVATVGAHVDAGGQG